MKRIKRETFMMVLIAIVTIIIMYLLMYFSMHL